MKKKYISLTRVYEEYREVLNHQPASTICPGIEVPITFHLVQKDEMRLYAVKIRTFVTLLHKQRRRALKYVRNLRIIILFDIFLRMSRNGNVT